MSNDSVAEVFKLAVTTWSESFDLTTAVTDAQTEENRKQ